MCQTAFSPMGISMDAPRRRRNITAGEGDQIEVLREEKNRSANKSVPRDEQEGAGNEKRDVLERKR